MRQQKQKNNGFTIVELLIVIIVIGILAAIVIVAYNGVTNRANDAAIQSDLQGLYKKIYAYDIQNGNIPITVAELTSLNIKVTRSAYSKGMNNGGGDTSWYNLLYCWPTVANPTKFSLIAQSKSGNNFQVVAGKVEKVSYVFTGSSSTCASAGTPMDSGATSRRSWLYENDNWQDYVSV